MSKRYERTTAGVRALLFDTMEGVRDGKIDVASAAAISNAAKQIINTLDIELKAQRQAFDLELGSVDALVIAPPTLKLTDGTQE